MEWIIAVSLAGLAVAVTCVVLNLKKRKMGQPYSSAAWGAAIMGILVMIFPGVFLNIGIGLIRGIFQIPGAIGTPDLELQFFTPWTLVILLVSSVLAVIAMVKLNQDAKKQGKSLSEYVMGHKPTEVNDDLEEELNETARGFYRERKGKLPSQHDQ